MKRVVIALLLSQLLCAPLSHATGPDTAAANARLGAVRITRGLSAEGPVVTLLGVPSAELEATLEMVSAKSALVIELNADEYRAGINKTDATATCSYLAGEIERLAQSAQNMQSLPSYTPALIVGVGAGAPLAHAIYAQHPKSFLGLAVWGGCGHLPLEVPLCKGDEFIPGYDAGHRRVTFSIQRKLPGDVVSVGAASGECAPGPLAERTRWQAELGSLLEKHHAPLPETGALPVIEIRAKRQFPEMPLVVFLSGDGGWATIDKRLGEHLADEGVDVVGFDSLRYYWSKKTPAEAAEAVGRVIAKYRRLWHRERVVLLGFSLGAEHIPIIYPLLSRDLQGAVPLAVLLSPERTTDFEVHISDWLGLDAPGEQLSVVAAIDALSGVKVACMYGERDTAASACTAVSMPGVIRKELPGDHHFNGAYKEVAGLVMALIRGWALGTR